MYTLNGGNDRSPGDALPGNGIGVTIVSTATYPILRRINNGGVVKVVRVPIIPAINTPILPVPIPTAQTQGLKL
jgi:hypothetical protein